MYLLDLFTLNIVNKFLSALGVACICIPCDSVISNIRDKDIQNRNLKAMHNMREQKCTTSYMYVAWQH